MQNTPQKTDTQSNSVTQSAYLKLIKLGEALCLSGLVAPAFEKFMVWVSAKMR
jgi:hypothetical protein